MLCLESELVYLGGVHVETHKQILETPVAKQQPGSIAISAKQVSILRHVIGYTSGAILTLLGLRFLLTIVSASAGNMFVDVVFTLSNVFTWPFSLVFSQISQGQWHIDAAALAGIAMYSTITWAIITLTRRIPTR